MKMREKNKVIVEKINERIKVSGLGGILFVEPIENRCKQRPVHGIYSDGTKRFAVFLWQLNKLSELELLEEIDRRVSRARNYFEI